jgi:hypothetical protein
MAEGLSPSWTTRWATRPTASEPQVETLCKRFSVVVPVGTVLILNVSATTALLLLLLLLYYYYSYYYY